jgi:hypothetical protein
MTMRLFEETPDPIPEEEVICPQYEELSKEDEQALVDNLEDCSPEDSDVWEDPEATPDSWIEALMRGEIDQSYYEEERGREIEVYEVPKRPLTHFNTCEVYHKGKLVKLITDDRVIEYAPEGGIRAQYGHGGFEEAVAGIAKEEIKKSRENGYSALELRMNSSKIQRD